MGPGRLNVKPQSLERRNRDLAALARRHGVRYEGVDLAPTL